MVAAAKPNQHLHQLVCYLCFFLSRSLAIDMRYLYSHFKQRFASCFVYFAGKESKNARKRRKRREMASRAADEELAEICLEQTVLKELRSKSHMTDVTKQETPTSKGASSTTQPASNKPQPAGKKSKQPISLNFADMISALEVGANTVLPLSK